MGVPRAVIVVDLGFGDAGKGLVTDFLVRELGSKLVVRFNGGAQAGHNVVAPDGRHHTFSQLGSGSFVPGVRTFLSRFFVLHPTALLFEARHLAGAGVPDALQRLTVSGEALVVTPFHQAANRLRELARGSARHGSCGTGVGEAVRCSLEDPEAIRARDLHRAGLRRSLERVREKLLAELEEERRATADLDAALAEIALLEAPEATDAFLEAIAPLVASGALGGADALEPGLEAGPVVFEGAQAVLIDEWRGFHPFTTWSTTTPANALQLLGEQGVVDGVVRLGVLRTYAVRHGPGPFPSEDPSLKERLPERHNANGPWQGPVRLGLPDLVLTRYAMDACLGLDALALTHLDALPHLEAWRACTAYRGAGFDAGLGETAGDLVTRVIAPRAKDLPRQEKLGGLLARCQPRLEEIPKPPNEHVAWLEQATGLPVRITSAGPTAGQAHLAGSW